MTALIPHAYAHEGVALTGELAIPAGTGPHPAVLVMHAGLGIGTLVRKRARDLAAAGYVALVTDMYGFAPDEQACRQGFAALQADPALLRGRVLAGFEAARALPGVDAARIAAMGFCFGGECVLELARSGADVAAVVSFHGGLRTKQPAVRGAVKARILVMTGAHDPYAPPADVEAFKQEMTEAEAEWHLTLYGQGWHAFTDPSTGARTDIPGVRYDPLLDRLSWAQSSAFLAAAFERT